MQRIVKLTLVLFAFVFAGCSISMNLPDGVEDQIPNGANRLEVITDKSVEETYEDVQAWLTSKGYPTETADEVSRTIDTMPAEIGQRTTLKIKLRINPYERGSIMEVLGTWSSDVEEATYDTASQGLSSEEVDWWPAVWQGKTRASYAYAQLINTFHDMPTREVRYTKQ